ncbi:calaxin-like [Microplitis mediator]|uniref:calaxin-like n=1 Tax=Microplitis mediator TaxID=375433 RepID=UPI0025538AB7|nr:calaxin-like [Microplitis mediator]
MTDMLNDPSKEIIYLKKNNRLFKKLVKETHFDFDEIKALALIHYKICKEYGPITRSIFRDILHAGFDFTENVRHLLMDRIFSTMTSQNSLGLNLEQWIKALSISLRGTLDQRIKSAFHVYDSLMTGKIRREQIFSNMRGCLIGLGDEDHTESLKDFVEMILKNLDIDRDGHISESDFSKSVTDKDLLLLECMGPVFPSREARHAFSVTFTPKTANF